jgi:hypothetical protein
VRKSILFLSYPSNVCGLECVPRSVSASVFSINRLYIYMETVSFYFITSNESVWVFSQHSLEHYSLEVFDSRLKLKYSTLKTGRMRVIIIFNWCEKACKQNRTGEGIPPLYHIYSCVLGARLYIYDICKQNLTSLKPLVDAKVIGIAMAKNVASSGLQMDHIKLAHKRNHSDGIKRLLNEKDRNGKIRVTDSSRIIKKLTNYLANC